MKVQSSLGFLGRQGTRVAATSILIGLAIPPLAAALRPLFAAAIFLMLVCSFLRVDPAALRARFSAPLLVAIASLGIMIGVPVLFGLALPYAGAERLGPGIALGMMMYMAAPPIMSSTAFAALLRLDTALTLAVLIVCTALAPLIAPFVVSYFSAEPLHLDALQLALRLFAILGGAFIVASMLRRFLGNTRIAENRETIDGINVILIMIFGITAMDGVTARAIQSPALVASLMAIVFALSIFVYAATTLAFWRQGLHQSLALGFSAANRNMGVMVAAAGSGLPELTWIYFAIAQFPIYLLPALAAPVVHRLMDRRLPGKE